MKQLMICYKDGDIIAIRHTLLTDSYVPVQDIISPQKTTFTIKKIDGIEISDFVILRDNDSGEVEYIGYIDTIENNDVTKLSCYPLINLFDNEFDLEPFYHTLVTDGVVSYTSINSVHWIKNAITKIFINSETSDPLQRMPFEIRDTAIFATHKKKYETSNLLEIYKDVFINTGVYIKFNDLEYNAGEISKIYCDICLNRPENTYYLRWDNPSVYSVNIVDNTFNNINKVIAVNEGERYSPNREYYLLNNNIISADKHNANRIKQVRSRVVFFNADEYYNVSTGYVDDDAIDKDLSLAVIDMLQVPEYNLKIEIVMAKNDNLSLYRKVDFVAESGVTYTTNITRLEILNDKQVKITLGALRNSLTDFKKKVERIINNT